MTGPELLTLVLATTGPEVPQGGGWEPKDYLQLITAATAFVALFVSYFVSSRTLKASMANTEASVWQKANEVEMSAIQEQLDRFFGPVMQMSEVNRLLSRDLRARQPDSRRFLLLESLFDREWLNKLPKGEQALVAEIAANAQSLRGFIEKNAKMVNAKVQPYLSRVATHYRILELAYEGKLGDHAKPFVDLYVFPVQIDEVLSLEVKRLERRKELLRSNPGKPVPPVEELVIPNQLKLKEWPKPPRDFRPELNVSTTEQ
ncbi:hypothetical protein [Bradyrhizobium sp. Ec3.3]|uniref:hypothetical protein n=1 Tax=Bradyrhizobium sp. Ec3.3 TaxID=189753 RepID=UPI0004852E58|nr:hypothetical protein [Bradyrhizobium sp. Ec3.3]